MNCCVLFPHLDGLFPSLCGILLVHGGRLRIQSWSLCMFEIKLFSRTAHDSFPLSSETLNERASRRAATSESLPSAQKPGQGWNRPILPPAAVSPAGQSASVSQCHGTRLHAGSLHGLFPCALQARIDIHTISPEGNPVSSNELLRLGSRYCQPGMAPLGSEVVIRTS